MYEILRTVPLFASLDPMLSEVAATRAVRVPAEKAKQGSEIARLGAPSPGLLLVVEGKVTLARASEAHATAVSGLSPPEAPLAQEGPIRIRKTLGSGSFWGQSALVRETLYLFSAVCESDAIVFSVTRDSFAEMLSSFPEEGARVPAITAAEEAARVAALPALHLACGAGDAETALKLIAAEAEADRATFVSTADRAGWTPLHQVQREEREILKEREKRNKK